MAVNLSSSMEETSRINRVENRKEEGLSKSLEERDQQSGKERSCIPKRKRRGQQN
jgi:hypothetical protein